MNKERKEQIVIEMLTAIGENPLRDGLKGTPDRVVRMWDEIFRGYDKKQIPKITVFKNGSDGIVYDQLINDEGTYYSFCEHHMVPFFGKYWFAYLPHPEGELIGLSKVARVVDYFSARLQIQERLTHQIVDFIWDTLCNSDTCNHKPLGIALIMEGEHLCKTMRGVKKKGKMRTAVLRGAFKIDEKTRNEFMLWVNKNG